MFTHLSRDISLLKNTSEKMGHSPPDDPMTRSTNQPIPISNSPIAR